MVDTYRDARPRGIYPPLFTDPDGDSCSSIYQIRWIKECWPQFLLLKLWRNDVPFFSLRLQNSEYPRIFQVTGANQNTRKLLSTDLVNTNNIYLINKLIREDHKIGEVLSVGDHKYYYLIFCF